MNNGEETKRQKLHEFIDLLDTKQINKLIQLIRGIWGKVV